MQLIFKSIRSVKKNLGEINPIFSFFWFLNNLEVIPHISWFFRVHNFWIFMDEKLGMEATPCPIFHLSHHLGPFYSIRLCPMHEGVPLMRDFLLWWEKSVQEVLLCFVGKDWPRGFKSIKFWQCNKIKQIGTGSSGLPPAWFAWGSNFQGEIHALV